jgi:hypothetical protein
MSDTTTGLPSTDATRAVLRHLVATLAYRASKVIRDAPPGFGQRVFGTATRQPLTIVAHMADLMEWATRMATTGEFVWTPGGGGDWDTEVRRFFGAIESLDRAIAAGDSFRGSIGTLIQAPLADALTHVGQLAMLRGMAGAPVRPESYARAAIAIGRIGLDQPPPGREFDGDASAR